MSFLKDRTSTTEIAKWILTKELIEEDFLCGTFEYIIERWTFAVCGLL